MSPILDLQRRLVELGRIRTGDQVEYQQDGKTKMRPRRLDTFRLTSASKELVEEAAALYGGQAAAWGEQWEVVIRDQTLPIMLPPGEALSQWNEMWSAGGCARRCDGEREMLSDKPCMCPADPAERRELAAKGQACKPTTRLNVILPELHGLGVWRLESGGYYAAVELAGAAEYLSMATSVGHRIPAHLRIVKRSVKRPGKDGKPQTRNFTVPTIDIDVRPMDLLAAGEMVGQAQIAAPVERLPSGPVNRHQRVERPGMPAPETLPEQANLARPLNPPLGEPPELPGESFAPADEEPEVAIVEQRPTLLQRLQDLGDELVGTVGTGRATDEQRVAVDKIVRPMGIACFANVLEHVWGLVRDPETNKWPLLAPHAAALIAASAEGDFQARYHDLGAAIADQI